MRRASFCIEFLQQIDSNTGAFYLTKCAALFYNAWIYRLKRGRNRKGLPAQALSKRGVKSGGSGIGNARGSVRIFFIVPLDHADADRQQHGGNDGCGEDKAVLKRKQEPAGQHLDPRVQQWSSSKYRGAFTCFLLRAHRNPRGTNGVRRRSCSRASYPD